MVETQFPNGGLVEASQAIEDGCLACAVRPDNRGDLPVGSFERDIVNRDKPAKPHRQVLNDE
jgi:hypothetical protein